MDIFPPFEELPKQFHILTVIRSFELKAKLAERITGIFGLLDFFDTVEASPKTQQLVKNFLDYLTRTCASEHLVINRAAWLVVYSQVVHDHLIEVKHGPVLLREISVSVERNEFHGTLERLVDAIVKYHSHPNVLNPLDHEGYQQLTGIVDLSEKIRPDTMHADYLKAMSEAQTLTKTLEDMASTGAVFSDDTPFLANQLRTIRYHTERFVSHKGVIPR